MKFNIKNLFKFKKNKLTEHDKFLIEEYNKGNVLKIIMPGENKKGENKK